MPALVAAPPVAASRGLLALWISTLVWFVVNRFVGFMPMDWVTKLAHAPLAYATVELAFLLVEVALLFRFAAGRRATPAAWPAWAAFALAALALPRAVQWLVSAMGGVLLSGQRPTVYSVVVATAFQLSFWLALTRSTTTSRGVNVSFYAVLLLKALPFFLSPERVDAALLAPFFGALTVARYLLTIVVLRNLVAGRRLLPSARVPAEPERALPDDRATDAMGVAAFVGLPLVSVAFYGVAQLFPLRGASPWFVPTVFTLVLSAVIVGTSWAMRFGSAWKAALPSLAGAFVLPYEYFWVSIPNGNPSSPRTSGLWNGTFYDSVFGAVGLGAAIVVVVTSVVVIHRLRPRAPGALDRKDETLS